VNILRARAQPQRQNCPAGRKFINLLFLRIRLSYAQGTPKNTNILECPRITESKLMGDFFYSRPLKRGLRDCPETSIRNYHYSLHNSPEERITQVPDDLYLFDKPPDALL
jgi:hypothetical protein